MALVNPSNIYSAGAVEVNTQPSVNIYAQHLQRKQAREEALDNYEMNRINRMNEQGVRDIDRPGLDAKVIDMKTYYQTNKDRIRKGGTPEAYNYEKMFRDTLAGVSKSKNATARAQTFANKIVPDRRKVGRNTPEEWFNEYAQHEETPIWDENFQDLDLPRYMSQTQVKYDADKILNRYRKLERTPGSPRYENIAGDKFNRNKFIDATYSPETLGTIKAMADDDYDRDDGFSTAVQGDINDTLKAKQLENIFKEAYGTEPRNHKDYAAAKVLSQLQLKVTGKPVKEELWKEKQDYMQQFKESNIRLASFMRGISAATNNPPFDLTNYTVTDDGQYDITQALKGVAMNRRPNGESRFANKVLYNPKTQEFTYFDPVEKEAIRKPFVQFIQDVKTNNPGMDMKFVETLKEPVGTRTPKNEQGGNKPTSSATYLIKGKKYTEAELIKMGYTTDQIKPYKQ